MSPTITPHLPSVSLVEVGSRVRLAHDYDGQAQRREVPAGSGAIACWGADWDRIVGLLANPIGEGLKEIRHKQTIWIVRATGIGCPGPAYFDLRRDNDTPGRRPVPENSGGQACWGGGWARIVELLKDSMLDACPEIGGRSVEMILRARRNGLRVEFLPDEATCKRRSADRMADLLEGPQVHCGGKNGLRIEFFDDDELFRARLPQVEAETGIGVQIHAGRLTWM